MVEVEERLAALEQLVFEQQTELTFLRKWRALMRQNGLDALESGNQFDFGGGIGRLDDHGIQLIPSTTSYLDHAIFWTPAFSVDPNALNDFVRVSGYITTTGLARWEARTVYDSFLSNFYSDVSTAEAEAQVQAYDNNIIASAIFDAADARGYALISLQGKLGMTNALSATLAGSVNDYAPTGAHQASLWRLDSSAGAVSITGMVALPHASKPTFRPIVMLHNVDATDTITLTDEDALSTAANRFALPGGNLAIPPDGCAILQYDTTSTRWRCLGASPGIRGTDDIGRDRLLYYQHYPQDSL